jgi:hypothetical protein
MIFLFIIIGVIAGIAGVSIAVVVVLRNRGDKLPKRKPAPKEIDGELFCPFCHSKVKPGQNFCDYCGNHLDM